MAEPTLSTGIRITTGDPLDGEELDALFADSWPDHRSTDTAALLRRADAWATARRGERLVGFIKVVWDGGRHAFLLDTTVHPGERRSGLGRGLVAAAAQESSRLGAEWLHVDYEPHLEDFYAGCGFRSTRAGLLRLR